MLLLMATIPIPTQAAGPGPTNSARPSAVADTTPPQANLVTPPGPLLTSLNEGFDNIATLAGNGWAFQNNSVPVGTTNWFQGTSVAGGGPFDAYDGAANGYIGANYNNTGNTGTISNWMITPVLDFGSNAALSFFTRKPSPDSYADRLEVRLSTNGASTNVGSTATSVGDFTTALLSVNPTLVLGVYPTTWTQFTANNLPHNGQGRIAFRYFVTGGGSLGTSSDYIGIDRVVYSAGAPEYQVSGTVNGFAASGLVLQLNGANDLPISASGAFTFLPYVTNGGNYSVTVSAQPTNPSQTCSISNGSGTISGANINNVTVACVTNTYTVGGNISGLAGSGMTLQLNGANDLPISASGGFVFPQAVASGGSYAVTVSAQPANPTQTCSVSNGSGIVTSSNITNVAITCVTNTYTVGGNVSGLSGSGLTLQLNGANDLPISASGGFVFPQAAASGGNYTVTVSAQPTNPAQTCSVTNGSGVVTNANVTNITVTCVTNTYTVGGNVSGLAGSGLTLQLNGANDLPISASGGFVFSQTVASGGNYAVTVSAQPANPMQTCSVSNNSGAITNANVTSVTVTCVTNTYTTGGNVSGLAGAGLTLQLNGANDLPISASGGFVFSQTVASGGSYAVTVSAQPTNPAQTCSVTSGNGTITNANVTSAAVNCATNQLPTSITLSTTPNPSAVGQSVTLIAVVSGQNATGTISFYDGLNPVGGCANVPLVGGTATCVTSTLTSGSHSTTASYSGDLSNAPSISNIVTQSVSAVSVVAAVIPTLSPLLLFMLAALIGLIAHTALSRRTR